VSARDAARRAERVVRRPRGVNIGFYLLRDLRSRYSARLNTHRQNKGRSVGEAVDYVEATYGALLQKAGLPSDAFEGKRVLELGPGDSLGLGLRLLAAGASQVVAVDRFAIRYDPGFEAEVYRELLERLPTGERDRAEDAVRPGPAPNPERLQLVAGAGIEEAPERFEPASFDVILSIAVLEHVQDSDSTFAAMDRLLRPGGFMVHAIDFRDHRMFTAGGGHPLEFLTVSDRVWDRMTVHSGGPNRRLVNYYRDKIAELGHEARLLVTTALGEDADLAPQHDALRESAALNAGQRKLVERIRPRLLPRYRGLSDEDLCTTTAQLVTHKPTG
jgi:SAM-dependent methyltransferase